VNLEQVFIGYLEEASGRPAKPPASPSRAEERKKASSLAPSNLRADETKALQGGAQIRAAFDFLSARRLFAYALREALELVRDPVRLAFAFCGPLVLMLVFGYGITFDVEELTYAALDRDRTPESRVFLEGFARSRYFRERPPLSSHAEMDHRLKSGVIVLAFEIPPGFGKELMQGRTPEVAAWIDGAMPFRAETTGGYVQGLYRGYLAELTRRGSGTEREFLPADIESRYRYNQDFKSIFAIVPSVIALMLVFIPAILMALGVVREKELGSITNLYVTPVTRLEFLFGKQLPYIALALINFVLMTALAAFVFGVAVKGSVLALCFGALLYVAATTGIGLLISSFTRTQIAALFGAAIATMVPATLFSGMMQPVSSLEGGAALAGRGFPTSYFMTISVGAFTKGLGISDLGPNFLALAVFIPVLTLLSALLLSKQER
jgi:ribosome-dependent ATPase